MTNQQIADELLQLDRQRRQSPGRAQELERLIRLLLEKLQ